MCFSTLALLAFSPLIIVSLWHIRRIFTTKNSLKNIPGPPSASWWKGNFFQVFDRINGWEFHRELRERYGGAVKLTMLFGDKQLYVTDPLSLHHIVQKDQDIFEETAFFVTSNNLFLGRSLLSTLGDQHKKQRRILNPVFSQKNMHALVPILYPVAHQLRDILITKVGNGEEMINVMNWLSRAALESIGKGGLGYSLNAFDENKSNAYSDAIKMLAPLNAKLFLYRQFLPYAVKLGSPAFRRKIVELLPFESIRTMIYISDTVTHSASTVLHNKRKEIEEEKLLGEQGESSSDILHAILRANVKAVGDDRMQDPEILGHMSAFLVAGHETTTSAICRILHQLALHPSVQVKLREEVCAARREHGDLDFNTLMTLPFLDAVCRETLRLFPPVPQLSRTTREDVILPLQWPIKTADGKEEIKEIFLKKNTNVIISIIGMNRSKRIWGEDAEEWKPERWMQSTSVTETKIQTPGIYSSTLTFLGGARSCIGFKFAEIEIKLIISVLLEKLSFSPGPDILWTMNFLQTPVVRGSGDINIQQLPLRLSLAI